MSEVMWVWDYELKTLGSWPSTGYNGHNTPVEVVTQMDVKALRDERDRLSAALLNVRVAWNNKNETTSLHVWHERMKAAMADVEAATTTETKGGDGE